MELIETVVQTLTLIVGVVAIGLGVRQYKRSVQLQTFSDFTHRYDDIITSLPASFGAKLFTVDEKLFDDPAAVRAAHRYFNLCSEEFYLHSKKYVDNKIWDQWKREIEKNVNSPFFERHKETILLNQSDYPDFANFLQSLRKV